MTDKLQNSIDLLINHFIFDDAQPMEDLTVAFEFINEASSYQSMAHLGHSMLIAMLKVNLAKLRTEKLFITAGLH